MEAGRGQPWPLRTPRVPPDEDLAVSSKDSFPGDGGGVLGSALTPGSVRVPAGTGRLRVLVGLLVCVWRAQRVREGVTCEPEGTLS